MKILMVLRFLLIPNKYKLTWLVNLTLENVHEWSDHEIIWEFVEYEDLQNDSKRMIYDFIDCRYV